MRPLATLAPLTGPRPPRAPRPARAPGAGLAGPQRRLRSGTRGRGGRGARQRRARLRARRARREGVGGSGCAPPRCRNDEGWRRRPCAATRGRPRGRSRGRAGRCHAGLRPAAPRSHDERAREPSIAAPRSGSQPVAALQAACLEHGPTCAGGHPRAEAVRPGALALVGLIRALHVCRPSVVALGSPSETSRQPRRGASMLLAIALATPASRCGARSRRQSLRLRLRSLAPRRPRRPPWARPPRLGGGRPRRSGRPQRSHGRGVCSPGRLGVGSGPPRHRGVGGT